MPIRAGNVAAFTFATGAAAAALALSSIESLDEAGGAQGEEAVPNSGIGGAERLVFAQAPKPGLTAGRQGGAVDPKALAARRPPRMAAQRAIEASFPDLDLTRPPAGAAQPVGNLGNPGGEVGRGGRHLPFRGRCTGWRAAPDVSSIARLFH